MIFYRCIGVDSIAGDTDAADDAKGDADLDAADDANGCDSDADDSKNDVNYEKGGDGRDDRSEDDDDDGDDDDDHGDDDDDKGDDGDADNDGDDDGDDDNYNVCLDQDVDNIDVGEIDALKTYVAYLCVNCSMMQQNNTMLLCG